MMDLSDIETGAYYSKLRADQIGRQEGSKTMNANFRPSARNYGKKCKKQVRRFKGLTTQLSGYFYTTNRVNYSAGLSTVNKISAGLM